MKPTHSKSSGNVFADLGFDKQECENLRIRSRMMSPLIADVTNRGVTQAHAARLLGITQPRASDLMRGKIHLFSIKLLVNLLAAAGKKVKFCVRRADCSAQ
jgi:predicted XRE-type DNA-binding protein